MNKKLLADFKKTLVTEAVVSPTTKPVAMTTANSPQDNELSDSELFAKATRGVTPLNIEATVRPAPASSRQNYENLILKRAAAEGAAEMAQEAISDTIALLNPVSSEAVLSFRRTGIQQGLFKKLKDGHLVWRAAVDLHGCTVEQARQAVLQLIHDTQQESINVIKIVHGKGYAKEQHTQAGLLKTCVNGWLQQHRMVLAFHSAPAKEGGTGAVLVLLKKIAANPEFTP